MNVLLGTGQILTTEALKDKHWVIMGHTKPKTKNCCKIKLKNTELFLKEYFCSVIVYFSHIVRHITKETNIYLFLVQFIIGTLIYMYKYQTLIEKINYICILQSSFILQQQIYKIYLNSLIFLVSNWLIKSSLVPGRLIEKMSYTSVLVRRSVAQNKRGDSVSPRSVMGRLPSEFFRLYP